MKKVIAIICILVLCFILAGCQNKAEIKYQNNSDLIYCTEDNVTEKVAKSLDKSKKELRESMQKNGMVFYGIAADNSYTVSIVKETTDFSEKAVDFSAFDEKGLYEISAEIAPNLITYHKTANEVYIVQDTVSFSAEGEHPARQYITVKNGSFYIITFAFANETLKDKYMLSAQNIVNDIRINTGYENFSFYSVIIVVLLLAIISVIVYVGITLLKDFKKAKEHKKTTNN